jgi:hypothetical protein
MNSRTQILLQSILSRVSLGAIPVDGSYWFEPTGNTGTAKKKPAVPDVDWSPLGLSLSRRSGADR